MDNKPLLGRGNHTAKEKGTRKMRAQSEGKGGQSLRIWVKLRVRKQIVDFFNWYGVMYSVVNRPLPELELEFLKALEANFSWSH